MSLSAQILYDKSIALCIIFVQFEVILTVSCNISAT